MLPEARGQAAPVRGAEQGRLEDTQAQSGHLDFLVPVGGDLPAAAVADDGVGAVPRLDDVEAFLDLPLQVAMTQIAGGKDGPLGTADFQHRLVSRMGGRPGEP